MAQIDQNIKKRGAKSGARLKRKSTQIDMTALVDVAFLLLTFFVLTSTMNPGSVMELVMPPKTDQVEDSYLPVAEKKVMTFILGENDQIAYYVGVSNPQISWTDYDPNQEQGIRTLIQQHIRGDGTQALCPKGIKHLSGCWDPIFVVKPKDNSRYQNLVDILDELAICGARKYAIDRYTVQDSLVLIGQR